MGSEMVVCNPGCFSQLQSWTAMSIYHMAQDRKHSYSIKAENPAAAVQRGQSCLSVQHWSKESWVIKPSFANKRY
jgi:hypothetical protein